MNPVHAHLEIADLIAKHFTTELSGREKETLDAWISASPANRQLWEQLQDDASLREQILSMPGAAATDAAWERLQSQLPQVRSLPDRNRRWRYAALVAGVLCCAGILGYLLRQQDQVQEKVSAAATAPARPAVIMPGGGKARLILGNGRVVELKDSEEQAITEEDGTQLKSSSSVLTYAGGAGTAPPVFNTLQTPRGGEYRVVLPDHSVVWLNASSSLRFPTRFDGHTRQVQLRGEAYFEIAENKSKPFIVATNNITVTVTGTKFNVKAYPDETDISTTLVEGGVLLRETDAPAVRPVMLQPGYEGVWENSRITVQEARLDEALAWKNGLFMFRSETLGSIMRKLGRWYDVEVTFSEAATADLRFTGTIRKYESIQKVLDMLALTQKVNFTINGKHISVIQNTR